MLKYKNIVKANLCFSVKFCIENEVELHQFNFLLKKSPLQNYISL